jgi:hypothetical protein
MFTIPSAPPSALALLRLLLALPRGRDVAVIEVDWEAGTFRYIVR